MDEFYRAVDALPPWLSTPLRQIPAEAAANIHEVRLRVGCGVALTIGGVQRPVQDLGWASPALKAMRLTEVQMEEILFSLCGGSIHAHQTELAEGYVTLGCGCRAGIGGRYLVHPEQGMILQQVRSVNLRIARSRAAVLPPALREILAGHFVGLLVVGEPDSGKTTVLRSMAAELAAQGRSVAVIDERGELFPAETSLPGAGARVDVISGLPKGRAVQMALRTLAPQALLLDELGGMDEVTALQQGFFGGVDLIATLHAAALDEALRRPQVAALRASGALRALVMLKGREAPGVVTEVRRL